MLHMFGCATRSITGHVPQPNTTPKLSPSMPLYGDAATRMAELSAVLRTDYSVWPAYFCSDRHRLIRTSLSRLAKATVRGATKFSFSVRLERRFSVPACEGTR